MTLLFASHNHGKSREIQAMVGSAWTLKNLHDLGVSEPIAETGDTLEENALIKARHLYDHYGEACFADDSGLEVKSLDRAPGVRSARYAGEQKSDIDNMDLLLQNLNKTIDRSAKFRTVIAYIDKQGHEHLFEGEVTGQILSVKKGSGGFGYDPIFQPDGSDCTFAEMSLEEKNNISHRALALKQLVSYLNTEDTK